MGSFIGRPECELLCQLTLPQQQKGAEAQKPSFPSTGFGFGAGLPPTSWAGLGQPTAHAAGAHRLVDRPAGHGGQVMSPNSVTEKAGLTQGPVGTLTLRLPPGLLAFP